MNDERTTDLGSSFRVPRSAFRDLFPVTNHLVYFNHAAVGPLSVRAAEAMERHAHDQRDYGALHWREWYAEHDALREVAARWIGAEPGEIAVVKNTSEGLSFVAQGLRWKSGDNVVTTALEFPSNWTPWKRLEERGVECRVAATPSVSDIEPLLDARTRLVTVSSVAFHNGFTADLVAIGELCAARDVRFCVDAIQSIGVLPIDVRAARIDFLAADGHKWMCGPEGAGLFFVAAGRLDELDVLENGWTNIQRKGRFLSCPIDWLPDSRRFEAGSPNTNGIFGLRAALSLLEEIGIDVITARAMAVAERLASALDALGWSVASPRPLRSPIVGAVPPALAGSPLLAMHRRLEERKIVCAPREGMLRFSPHFYNDENDVARIAEAIGEAMAD